MKINYPETIIEKSSGTNDSETYLSKLCDRTFLSLWSYPNVYRDQGRIRTNDGQLIGEGKELCDLLVVFENHILIFSDKNCAFTVNGDYETAWIRWYKRAIDNSASQIFGAERWIFKYPGLIYLDRECKQKFPINIPPINEAYVHRIVIAHGAAGKCQEYFHGDSGSLFINNQILGKQHYDNRSCEIKPFQIGMINPEKGFVHVFDDFSLDIVMRSVDTVSDFTDYLMEKERFLLEHKQIVAAGEEELLALYLTSTDQNGKKSFSSYYNDQKYDSVIVSQGSWQDYTNSSLRARLVEANKTSYFWDALIDKFLFHVTTGTSGYMSSPSIVSQEEIFRILAKENRMRRRILSDMFLNFMNTTENDCVATRVVMPEQPLSPAYLFFLFPYRNEVEYNEYREVRRDLLSSHITVLKKQFPFLINIIGIATETKDGNHSEDIAHLDASEWTEDDNEKACKLEKMMICEGVLNNRVISNWRTFEYPKDTKTKYSGNKRNVPCPCGSGKKYKKCCGQNRNY